MQDTRIVYQILIVHHTRASDLSCDSRGLQSPIRAPFLTSGPKSLLPSPFIHARLVCQQFLSHMNNVIVTKRPAQIFLNTERHRS